MPKLVIINGKPAVGKSTLAHLLRENMGMPVLGKDDIKEFLFDKIGVVDRDWSHLVGQASVEMLYAFAQAFIENKKDVIVENAFWAEHARPHVQKLCEYPDVDCLEVYCSADQMTREYRNRQRVESGARHQGHFDAELVIDDTVDNVRYQPLGIGKIVHIDTTQLDEAGYNAIVQEIKTFLYT